MVWQKQQRRRQQRPQLLPMPPPLRLLLPHLHLQPASKVSVVPCRACGVSSSSSSKPSTPAALTSACLLLLQVSQVEEEVLLLCLGAVRTTCRRCREVLMALPPHLLPQTSAWCLIKAWHTGASATEEVR